MFQPPGFVNPSSPTHVCLLQKSLYGLKQAPRAWFQRFASFLLRIGFVASQSDSSLFIYGRGTLVAYLILYVDDIILTASTNAPRASIIATFSTEFAMSDLGLLS